MKQAAVVVAALCLFGCAKNIDNKDAVVAAIQKRVVKTGFTLDNMTVNVTRVTFHDNEAQATVSFIPKGAAEANGVTFKYNLRREKDEWVVTGPATGDAAGHPGVTPNGMTPNGTALPGVAPATPGGTAGPIDPSRPLPQGHPPIGSKQ